MPTILAERRQMPVILIKPAEFVFTPQKVFFDLTFETGAMLVGLGFFTV